VLNRLVDDDVAIVTPAPGTTRDVLRQQVHIDGLPLNLIDTAGLRVAHDAAEEEGVRRARREMQRADRILYVVDAGAAHAGAAHARAAHAAAAPEDLATELAHAQVPGGVPITVVFNKIDLIDAGPRIAGERHTEIFLSALTGAGLELLRTHLKDSAGYRDVESGALAARRRHLDALARARALVQSAAEALKTSQTVELFAEDLRLAQLALGEITGEVSSDDLLGAIFGSFCIGK
jgi:tRNA modification GTPase